MTRGAGERCPPGPRARHYSYFRYYDPTIGRYVSADPIGQAGGINIYRYAANNPLFWFDPYGLDIAVIENGPTEGNPIGHTAIAVTGAGVYSSGNDTPAGSSLYDYLLRESSRRDTTVTVIPTTPEQDQAALDYVRGIPADDEPGFFTDNCSSRSNNALDAAGVPQTAYPDNVPGSAGDRAEAAGGTQTSVPQNTNFPGGYQPSLSQFEPGAFP